jgi:4-hydroxyphenylpyruvate dioxygenase-like putative hemolysin
MIEGTVLPAGDAAMSRPPFAGLKFHHFGLAVPAPQAAFRYLEALGYTEGNKVFDPMQKVNLAMRHHSVMPDVEVIWSGEEPSPIDKMIKRNGSMIYHICYEVADPDAAVALIEASGLDVVLVSPPTPAPLFGGREVSFHSVEDFGLIELLRATAD